MKKIKSAISLALLAVAPTIYAQNIDTKAAPDVPTFQVTLNVTNNGGGLDSVFVKKTIEKEKDSLILSGTKSLKLTYDTKPSFRLKANSQYMLESFTVNGVKETGMDEKFNDVYKDVNSYAYTPANGLKGNTDIVIKWIAKPEVKVTVSGTEQIVKNGEAVVTVSTSIQSLTPTIAYFKDADCKKEANTESRTNKVGTFYVKITSPETADHKAIEMVVPMVVNNKTELVVGTDESAPKSESTLLQGQPLSAAAITGGKVTVKDKESHVIKGTWAWANPNALVESGMASAKTYDAIFTPDSAAVYNTATAKIGVTAKPVMNVTVNQTAGGVVAIENASADNKYIGSITDATATANPKITVTATPDAGYKFDSWVGITSTDPGEGVDKEAKVTSSETTITANTVVSAKFVKATRAITITAPTDGNGNSLKVLNGTQEVATGTAVPVGTTLAIVATPGEDQEVVKVGYTKKAASNTVSADPATEANSFIVSGAAGETYTIAATFQAKPADQFLVSLAQMNNGALKLKNGTADIAPNSSVEKGSYVSIIAMPNRGYKLGSLTANGTDIKDASGVTVTDETTIAAVFVKETYPVAVTAPTGVSINVTSGTKAFETNLGHVTVTETDPGNYRLLNLLVNNKPVANGSEVVVDGPTNISAQVKKLTALSILNEPETTVTYSGKAQEYAVKTTANLGGFSVKYLLNGKDTIPTGAGTYTVQITRPADDIYAAITEKAPITRTLVIEPGMPGIKDIPLANAATGGEVANSATVAGIWTTTDPRATKAAGGLRADADLQTIWFIPSDKNLMIVSAITPKDQNTANSLDASVTLPANVSNGSIVLMNGDVAVAAGQKVYKGQTMKIKLIPDAGYMISDATLSGATPTISVKDEYTLTLTGTHTLTASGTLFITKTDLSGSITSTNNKEKTYTGSPIELKATELTLPAGFPTDKWVISYQKGGNSATPTNVITGGGYDILISRPEDAAYKAVPATSVGTLTINPVEIRKEHITVPTATAVTTDETLLASYLTGGSVVVNGVDVSGTFSWKDNTTAVSNAGTYDITFTPADQLNYSTTQIKSGLSSYVSLKDASSFVMTLKTENEGAIKITNAAGGTIDQEAPTIKVAAGMKLFVETAATGTKIDKIVVVPETTVTTETTGDKQVWSFIAPADDFTVTVTFTKESSSEGGTPGETPEEGTPVTGISLNKSALTLPRLKSEKLVATVAPTGATKKEVKWTSTDSSIASVDAEGTVKAIAVGKATIIATTADGGFSAMCEVTVDYATGIEKILSESYVYGQKGQIRVEPAAPVEVTIVNLAGVLVYKNLVNGTEQIPVYSGVYIVRLSAAGKATTTKVIVR